MFNFSTFISLLVAIIAIYIPLHLTLKKELEDLEINSKDNMPKIRNRENRILALNITCLILAIILIILYKFPIVTSVFKNSILPKILDIVNFLGNFLPFKKDFFIDPHFKFSFITGIILSLFVFLCGFATYAECSEDIESTGLRYILGILLLLALAIGLIWANNFISLFLTYCIIHCFEMLSIILNVLAYSLMFGILCLIIFLYEEFL